jgi:hypothetical protein
MRVLVTGGRDFALPDEVHRILMPIHASSRSRSSDTAMLTASTRSASCGRCSMGIETRWGIRSATANGISTATAPAICATAHASQFKPELGVASLAADGTADMTGS